MQCVCVTYEPRCRPPRGRSTQHPTCQNGRRLLLHSRSNGNIDRMGDSIERATLKSALAVGGPLLSGRCWVAHVLLLFHLMGLIGPFAIPPNDQLREPERARAFPRIVGVSKRQNKQHCSVCLLLETDPPDWQRRRRRCQTGS